MKTVNDTLLEEYADQVESRAIKPPPCGPGFSKELARYADCLQLWVVAGSSTNNNDDICLEYRLLRKGRVFAVSVDK